MRFHSQLTTLTKPFCQMSSFRIREATVDDCEEIERLIKATAKFHNNLHRMVTNANVLKRDGFGDRPWFRCIVAEMTSTEDKAKRHIAGVMIFYHAYCGWTGRVIFLEDIFVVPSCRQMNVGNALFNTAVEMARDNDCAALEWDVAIWNKKSFQWIQRQHGITNKTAEEGWQNFSMGRDALRNYRPPGKLEYSSKL